MRLFDPRYCVERVDEAAWTAEEANAYNAGMVEIFVARFADYWDSAWRRELDKRYEGAVNHTENCGWKTK